MRAPVYSIIASQIGYRPGDPKMVVIRCGHSKAVGGSAQLCDADTGACAQDGLPIAYWGEKWGAYFWTVDFSAWKREGAYYISVPEINARSNAFRIQIGIFLNMALEAVSVGQLEQRIRGKMGWQDCGSDLRAVEGHALQLLGLADSLKALQDRMPEELRQRYIGHIRRGAEYLMACQREDGSFVNELYVDKARKSWTLCLLAVISLIRAYECLGDIAYLNVAKHSWDWGAAVEGYTREERVSDIDNTRKIYGKYTPWLPPAALRVRDRLLLIWAGTALYRCTNDLRYKDRAVAEARTVCGRLQVVDTAPDNGLYGHFRVWEDSEDYQKGWEHSGWGYGCGTVLPDELTGIMDLIEMFPEDEDYHQWVYSLLQYAYGYMLPASGLSPYGIMPLGVFEDRVMFFGPSWHGFNGMYGRYARLAMRLARFCGDMRFQDIALSNLQWVMGLNTGVPSEAGAYEGLSWISGVGANAVQAWTGIAGSICNGFCANPQFKLMHLDDIVDNPAYITGEEWIVHNGGFLSGLSEIEKPYVLKIKTQYRGKPVDAGVSIRLDNEVKRRTGLRGFLRVENLPVGERGEVRLSWEGVEFCCPIETIAGMTKVIPVDFSDCFTADIRQDADCLALCIVSQGKDATEISAFIYGVGVQVSRVEIKASVKRGSSQTLKIPYQLQSQKQHLWARAYVAGRYHGAVCEHQWKQKKEKENAQ